jgi:hypothetical protein
MAVAASVVEYAMAIARAGSAAALAISIGTAPDAANRVGYYSDLTASAEKLGVVVGGITGPTFDRSGSSVVMSGVKLQDSTLQIVDQADITKSIAFQCASIGSGFQLTIDAGAQAANRTLSVPVLSASDTIATLDVANTFTQNQTLSKVTPVFKLNDTGGASDPLTFCYLGFARAGTEKGFIGFGDGAGGLFSIYNGIGNLKLQTIAGGSVNIVATTASTSTTTGALVVTGGVGIGGRLNAGEKLTVTGSASELAEINSTNADGAYQIFYRSGGAAILWGHYKAATGGSSMHADGLFLRSANGIGFGAASGSIDLKINIDGSAVLGTDPTGSELLRVGGSVRFAGAFIGTGSLAATNIATLNNTSATGYGPSIAAGADATYYCMRWDDYSGALLMKLDGDGILSLTNATASTSTTTGSLINAGGFGCAGAAMFGGSAITSIAATEVSIGGGQVRCGDAFFVDNGTVRLYAVLGGSIGYMGTQSTHNFVIRSNNLDRISVASGGPVDFASACLVNINNVTEATTTTAAALVISGGIGVAKAVIIGSATASISTTTGALIVNGGVGIGGAVNIGGSLTLSDATNLVFNTTTGNKIGTSNAQKIGVWNATPIVQPAAYTQTFATAARTMNAYTSDAESSAYTGIDNAQGGTPYAQLTDLNTLRVAYENLRAMADNLQQVVNSLIDDHQAIGLCA